MRVLRYKELYIDECNTITDSDESMRLSPSLESIAIHDVNQAELNLLTESYNKYSEAKQVYESALNSFWKSDTGALCRSILMPEPATQDRELLREKIKELETRLHKSCICIKYKSIEISGYDHIRATYIVKMFEVEDPPQVYGDFRLSSWRTKPIEEIPKLWTNKMALEQKKEMELVYVFGNVLPPYRIQDMIKMTRK